MAIGDLATLASVKEWINSSGTAMATTDDALLARLITAASQAVRKEIVRNVVMQTYTADPYNGNGRQRLTLKHAPIFNVSKVLIGGVIVPRSLDGITGGYMWRSYGEIQLIGGYLFGVRPGLQSVFVTYQAGYYETMTVVVPTTPFQVTPPLLEGSWNSDLGVVNAAGTPLVLVVGTPSTGQYSVSSVGVYTFAAADVGTSLTLSCGIVPSPIQQAVIELCALKYRERKRIGEKSTSLHAQTVSYFNPKDIRDNASIYLDPYKRVGFSV